MGALDPHIVENLSSYLKVKKVFSDLMSVGVSTELLKMVEIMLYDGSILLCDILPT